MGSRLKTDDFVGRVASDDEDFAAFERQSYDSDSEDQDLFDYRSDLSIGSEDEDESSDMDVASSMALPKPAMIKCSTGGSHHKGTGEHARKQTSSDGSKPMRTGRSASVSSRKASSGSRTHTQSNDMQGSSKSGGCPGKQYKKMSNGSGPTKAGGASANSGATDVRLRDVFADAASATVNGVSDTLDDVGQIARKGRQEIRARLDPDSRQRKAVLYKKEHHDEYEITKRVEYDVDDPSGLVCVPFRLNRIQTEQGMDDDLSSKTLQLPPEVIKEVLKTHLRLAVDLEGGEVEDVEMNSSFLQRVKLCKIVVENFSVSILQNGSNEKSTEVLEYDVGITLDTTNNGPMAIINQQFHQQTPSKKYIGYTCGCKQENSICCLLGHRSTTDGSFNQQFRIDEATSSAEPNGQGVRYSWRKSSLLYNILKDDESFKAWMQSRDKRDETQTTLLRVDNNDMKHWAAEAAKKHKNQYVHYDWTRDAGVQMNLEAIPEFVPLDGYCAQQTQGMEVACRNWASNGMNRRLHLTGLINLYFAIPMVKR